MTSRTRNVLDQTCTGKDVIDVEVDESDKTFKWTFTSTTIISGAI